MQLARIHQYLSMAMPLLWLRQADTIGALGLALNACAEQDGYADTVDRIGELLETSAALWASLPERNDDHDRLAAVRLCLRLIHLADIETLTGA